MTALGLASEPLSLQCFIIITAMLDIAPLLYTMAVLSLRVDNYALPPPEKPRPRGCC